MLCLGGREQNRGKKFDPMLKLLFSDKLLLLLLMLLVKTIGASLMKLNGLYIITVYNKLDRFNDASLFI